MPGVRFLLGDIEVYMCRRLTVTLCSLLAASALTLFGVQAQQQKKESPGAEKGAGEDKKRSPNKVEVISDPEKKEDCHDTRTVIVRAILRANRKVTDIEVDKESLKGLPEAEAKDLTERCRRAASEIKFEPAVKDGHPISQRVRLEYNFCMDDVKWGSSSKK
ncbi:MAG: hypothetical protein ACJ74T_16800 [Pyrinomonadaceae bacterium]